MNSETVGQYVITESFCGGVNVRCAKGRCPLRYSPNRAHFPFIEYNQDDDRPIGLPPDQRWCPVKIERPQMQMGCGVLFTSSTFEQVCRFVASHETK